MLKKFSRILSISLSIGILISMFACNNSGNKNTEDPIIKDDTTVNSTTLDKPQIEQNVIDEIISSMPAPVEMAALIHDLNAPFNPKYLISPDLAKEYESPFKKALALGFYSADLGYLNVYNETNSVVEYLSALKSLADDLEVGDFFDFHALKKLATTNDNMDSLLFMSVHSYHEMDANLRKNNRSHLSLLSVIGVWIEGNYLLCNILDEIQNQEIKDRIGEQKKILNSINPIIEIYKDQNENFKKLAEDFNKLKIAYEPVIIEEIRGDSYINSEGVFIQTDSTIIKMSDKDFNNIVNITKEIRNNIISE